MLAYETRPWCVSPGKRRSMQYSYLSIDELDVLRALRVTVAGTKLGTRRVGRILRCTAILVHLDEVDGAVETTWEVGNINIERELLVHEFEHLIAGIVLHQVDSRADVGAGHEVQGEGVAIGGDTISGLVLSAVESALLCASSRVRANAGVPFVTSVTVGVPIDNMDPTLVGVEHDAGGDRHTSSSSGALLGG